jgi:hypothetical protein
MSAATSAAPHANAAAIVPPPRSAIISSFYEAEKIDMEAERLNAIESALSDLRQRAVELRGYL